VSVVKDNVGLAARFRRQGASIGLLVLMLSPSLLYLCKLPDFLPHNICLATHSEG